MKKNIIYSMSLSFILLTNLLASPSENAQKLGLIAGNKASIQWKRVFKSERKMKRYHINKLTKTEQEKLEKYLINHAADSDQPTVAGM